MREGYAGGPELVAEDVGVSGRFGKGGGGTTGSRQGAVSQLLGRYLAKEKAIAGWLIKAVELVFGKERPLSFTVCAVR
ncbi:hypothetical protein [Altericroceibacterium endophyticum]|uniref:Uncharacterized protein n=1 Tax=Altericroceibacterium endophyticum TaxID=1808508 RepID=A0A6I4T8L4_9SPHN|nr:hypothetical protein [Altericroceibacterium endophyticum]MXO66363.1 hypothetical protein [Altericroceibacterium endophyticum]